MPTCIEMRMPSGKVVGPSNSSQKARTHFTALWQRPIWAMVYALIGEQDPAITLIERLLSTPGPFPGPGTDYPSEITLADLRLRWEWDSVRSKPRFQKIIAGPEPQTVY